MHRSDSQPRQAAGSDRDAKSMFLAGDLPTRSERRERSGMSACDVQRPRAAIYGIEKVPGGSPQRNHIPSVQRLRSWSRELRRMLMLVVQQAPRRGLAKENRDRVPTLPTYLR